MSDVIFKVHGKDMFTLCENGDILVEGRKATNDIEVVNGFKAWLAQANEYKLLMKALEFYADANNYALKVQEGGYKESAVMEDCGNTARNILVKIEVNRLRINDPLPKKKE